MARPQIAPDTVTVPPKYPSAATAPFAASATGSVRTLFAIALVARSSLISDVNHSTAAAKAGTEMLSSSLIGIVSTAAAPIAASHGIQMENHV